MKLMLSTFFQHLVFRVLVIDVTLKAFPFAAKHHRNVTANVISSTKRVSSVERKQAFCTAPD